MRLLLDGPFGHVAVPLACVKSTVALTSPLGRDCQSDDQPGLAATVKITLLRRGIKAGLAVKHGPGPEYSLRHNLYGAASPDRLPARRRRYAIVPSQHLRAQRGHPCACRRLSAAPGTRASNPRRGGVVFGARQVRVLA